MKIHKAALAIGVAAVLAAAPLGADAQAAAPITVVSVLVTNPVSGPSGDDGDFSAPGGVYVQFVNDSDKTATTVVFELHERVRGGGRGSPNYNTYKDLALGKIRDTGTFAPDVAISRTHANRWKFPLHIHQVSLVPVEVDYSDGTTWKAPGQ
jgi:hypothetical protein